MSRPRAPFSSWLAVATTLAASVALLVPRSARAEGEPIAIRYAASGVCPSEAAFLAKVRSYTTRWELVPEGTSATRTIRVRVAEDSGSLAVESASGVLSEREIGGPNCTAVAEALAIMVAVAIDPQAATSSQAPDRTHDEPARAPEAEARPAPPTSNHVVVPPAPPPNEEAPVSSSLPRVSLDLRAEVTSAVVRGGLFVAAASVKLELPPATGPRWVQRWRPSVALGIRQSFPKDRDLNGGSAEFLWTAGNVRLCPLQIALSAVELSPCAELNVGRLHASAVGFLDNRGASTLWLDAGGSGWATVRVSSRLFFSVNVLLTAPLTRQPFALASGASVSEAPAVGVLGGVGLGVRL